MPTGTEGEKHRADVTGDAVQAEPMRVGQA
jgi:hypothetical protein